MIDISHRWRLSGYGIVTNNLIPEILKNDTENKYIFTAHKKLNINSIIKFKNREFISTDAHFIQHKFFKISKFLKQAKPDIFVSLDQDIPIWTHGIPTIITSHDIGAQLEWTRKNFKKIFQKKSLDGLYHTINLEARAIKKSRKIITPSERTKNDIVKKHKQSAQKISVCHRGLDHITTMWTDTKKDENLAIFPYSNSSQSFQYKLAEALIGKKIFQKIIFMRPATLPTQTISPKIEIITEKISNQRNIELYQTAKISFYFSDYDGFWFVPLESAILGTPTIYLANSCLTEITGESGAWIYEENLEKFIELAKKLKENHKFYAEKIKNAQQKQKDRTREKTAKNFIEEFKKIWTQ